MDLARVAGGLLSACEMRTGTVRFVYRSDHAGVMRRRREWFEQMETAYLALWWIEAGHIPTVAEAKSRLDHLAANGPTRFAFTFRLPFPPPDSEVDVAAREDDLCGV